MESLGISIPVAMAPVELPMKYRSFEPFGSNDSAGKNNLASKLRLVKRLSVFSFSSDSCSRGAFVLLVAGALDSDLGLRLSFFDFESVSLSDGEAVNCLPPSDFDTSVLVSQFV